MASVPLSALLPFPPCVLWNIEPLIEKARVNSLVGCGGTAQVLRLEGGLNTTNTVDWIHETAF